MHRSRGGTRNPEDSSKGSSFLELGGRYRNTLGPDLTPVSVPGAPWGSTGKRTLPVSPGLASTVKADPNQSGREERHRRQSCTVSTALVSTPRKDAVAPPRLRYVWLGSTRARGTTPVVRRCNGHEVVEAPEKDLQTTHSRTSSLGPFTVTPPPKDPTVVSRHRCPSVLRTTSGHPTRATFGRRHTVFYTESRDP